MDWRDLGPDEIEFQYNPQRSVPDFQSFQVRRAAVTERAKRSLRSFLDVAYGEGPLQRLDIFPAETADAPLHLFFHGGYWRAQDKANFAFVANLLVPVGVCTVIVNYDLCPAATLDGVVDSALRAIAWSYVHARDYGGDPQRLTLSGNSAGAHLIAMALAADWHGLGLPEVPIRGTVQISGIYDPEPASRTTVNAQLNLTPDIIARNNALLLPPRQHCPVALFVGGDEPTRWIEQTELYQAHLRRHGLAPSMTIVPGHHHFSIMDDYLDPHAPLANAVINIARHQV